MCAGVGVIVQAVAQFMSPTGDKAPTTVNIILIIYTTKMHSKSETKQEIGFYISDFLFMFHLMLIFEYLK